MDEDNKVVADARDTFGKGAARKIRAAGQIPAVLYGHGADPQHLTITGTCGKLIECDSAKRQNWSRSS